jgi:hypothetical protein
MRRFAVGDSTSDRELLEESDEASPPRFRFERVVADLVVAETLRVERVGRAGAAFAFAFGAAFAFAFAFGAAFAFAFAFGAAFALGRFFAASASFFFCAADFWYLPRGRDLAAPSFSSFFSSVFSFLVFGAPFSNPLALREGADGPAAAATGEAGGGTNGRQRTELRAG